ncbi:MAG: hypothetical protein LBJ67_12015 [Planctomycetaceae bacterium]|nr:hypothetical protein [Planctomycetaceae bacterium]
MSLTRKLFGNPPEPLLPATAALSPVTRASSLATEPSAHPPKAPWYTTTALNYNPDALD